MIFFRKVFLISSLIFIFSFYNFSFAEEIILDTTPPVISLIGESDVVIDLGDTYTDQGATGFDEIDGDITSLIVVSNNVDTNTVGLYTITYDVSDSSNNQAVQIERRINVVEKNLDENSSINIFIRNGENIIYNSVFVLPEEGVINILDNKGENHEINNQSLLSILHSISQIDNAPFTISNLQYYSSMGALYLKCITEENENESCDNWQYVVNGVSPWTAIDQTIVENGQSVSVYFGNPHKLVLDKNEIKEGESILVNSFKYNYIDNIWEILNNVNIIVTTPNDLDPFNPNTILETLVNEDGVINILLENEGIYTFGIKEDYSFPSYQVTVIKNNNGGSSGGGSFDENEFSLQKAISFLILNQENGNLFGNELYNDWVAIGIAKSGNESKELKTKIVNYLKNYSFDSEIITDYERHAMALMSYGINPYDGTDIDYIKKIISSFDGDQIGESSLYNDDIFALIVLSKSGYTEEDEIIKKIVSHILSKQSSAGSWESVDMTSAAILGLSNFEKLNEVEEAISNGLSYIKSKQKLNGSFNDDPFSTSWAIQALSIEDNDTEIEKGINYLVSLQQEDGGLLENNILENRIWATAYATPAILELSWNDILESFERRTEEIPEINEKEEILEENIILPEEKEEEELDVKDKKEDELIEIIVEKKLVKEKKNKKEILKEEVLDSENPLLANVLNIDKEINDNFLKTVISQIFSKIKSPFIWFWDIFSFLI